MFNQIMPQTLWWLPVILRIEAREVTTTRTEVREVTSGLLYFDLSLTTHLRPSYTCLLVSLWATAQLLLLSQTLSI